MLTNPFVVIARQGKKALYAGDIEWSERTHAWWVPALLIQLYGCSAKAMGLN